MSAANSVHRSLAIVFALIAASQPAHGDEDRHRTAAPLLPAYAQECAACHVAYPPGMLPSASWRRLLNDLPRHYATDASLDPATVDELATWLSANAGTYKRVRETPPEDRISKSAWFIRKHDEVPAAVWQRPAVKSAANCTACHTQAAQGDFNDHSVRIPR
jgi:mono/diheme cytochrome c family protein